MIFLNGLPENSEEIYLLSPPDFLYVTDYVEGRKKIESFRKDYGAEITVMDMDPVDASSTKVRDNVREGRPISGLVLPEVEEYIIEHQLYR